jgi:ribosomal protein L11 methyltransferase
MLRLDINVLVEQEDLLEDWCWQWGALAVYRKPVDEVSPGGIRQVGALFNELNVTEFSDRAFMFFPNKTLISIHTEEVREEAWQESWRKNFEAFSVGPLRIVPEWDGVEPDERTLLVYPGQAFGTGQHETTKLMIRAILKLNLKGKTVLDAGCGTGILSIVAENRGASQVFGFDSDVDCRENMQRHLKMNHTKKTQLEVGRWDDLRLGTYDLVLINITLNVLRELWPKIPSVLKPGGTLLTTGVLLEQADEAIEILNSLGFKVEARTDLAEWCLFRCTMS